MPNCPLALVSSKLPDTRPAVASNRGNLKDTARLIITMDSSDTDLSESSPAYLRIRGRNTWRTTSTENNVEIWAVSSVITAS